MNKRLLNIILSAFWILSVIILAVSTALWKRFGADFASENIYSAPFFIIFWSVFILLSAFFVIKNGNFKKNPAIIGIHSGIGFIFIGALLTFFTSQKGLLHLRMDGTCVQKSVVVPFDVKLVNFTVNYYPGTEMPNNFVSTLQISDRDEVVTGEVSMNHIFRYRGYRFYQTAYDRDYAGTKIKVNYDPYGTPVTYIGFGLFFLSFMAFLLNRNSRFRLLIRKTLLFLILSGLFFVPSILSAQRTITTAQSKQLAELSISYNGRICPLDTYCQDVCYTICGDKNYKHFNSVQVVVGWLFYPEDWFVTPMFKISSKEVRTYLSVEQYAELADFFTQNGDYKLDNSNSALKIKDLQRVESQLAVVQQLRAGNLLKLFPYQKRWYSPTDDLSNLPAEKCHFIHDFIPSLYLAVSQKNDSLFTTTIQKTATFQRNYAEEDAISSTKTAIELIYNRFRLEKMIFILNLCCAVIAFIYLLWQITSQRKIRWLNLLLLFIMNISLILLIIRWVTRWYLSGHIPLSNEYETLLFVSGIIMIISLSLWKKSFIAPFSGFLLSGLTLLLATIKITNPQITALMPVLHSPWLSIHVSVIMMAYACLGFTLLISVICLFIKLSTKDNNIIINKLTDTSKLFLYPATGFLCVGIMAGSIWANTSWGQYWSWDPKEVWALITLLLYALPLHESIFPIFRRPWFYHIYMVIAFLSLLMTYFGVNLFLGGVHSYS